MTLHITTITPNHIISASDKLISTWSKSDFNYLELDNDLFKYVALLNRNTRATVSFAGLAGLTSLPNQTIDWLTKALSESNTDNQMIDKQFEHIKIAADDYIARFSRRGIPAEALRLAIFASGWTGTKEYGDVPYWCCIDNCIDKYWTWAPKARPKFTMFLKHYGGYNFKDGFVTVFLGNARLGLKQRAQIRVLEKYAKKENPRKIFECSVDIIRAASAISNGTIGLNCAGERNSKGDPGIEGYLMPYNKRDDGKVRIANTVFSF
jgi:hypothetical protein